MMLASTLLASPALVAASDAAPDTPHYTADGQLVKPLNYREWVLIGTGLNMAYGPVRGPADGAPPFTNVFVNPASYRAFLQDGAWPDRTVFILEGRDAVAVNKAVGGGNGYYQGELSFIEAEVKDEKRFAGGWAFFGLSGSEATGAQIPAVAACYSCHAKNAAVENTFVQFYPVLRDVAKRKGTFKNVPESF